MKLSPKGEALIKEFEGLSLKAYICPAGYLTIGWGHLVRPEDDLPSQIDLAKAKELFAKDIVKYEVAVTKMVKVPINQGMFDALVSFAFNLGITALSTSTLLRLLNAKNYAGARDQFARWNKASVKGKTVALPGLTRRRAAEAKLFSSDMFPS